MFNFHVIPHKRSGRAGGFSVSAVAVSALFLAAALFLVSCTDEDTVEVPVPGPTVTTTVPGPTVTVPADITGTDGDDDLSHLTGSAVDDTIDGKGGDDMMQGGDGDDELMGGDGNDEISGGVLTLKKEEDATDNAGNAIKKSVTVTGCERGKDMRIDGDDGNDTIRGGAGDDSLYGGSGDDTIYGEGGDDTICGNNDDDKLYGGDGDDTLDGGLGDDDIDGGAGDDLVDYSLVAHPNNPIAGIEVNLARGGTVRDGAYGRDKLTGIEKIKGNSLDDKFTGDDGDNTFMPGAGADTVDGGGGSDTLDYSDAVTLDGDGNPTTTDAGVTISLIDPDTTPTADGKLDCADKPAKETIITVTTAGSTATGDMIVAPHGEDKNGAVTCLSSIENLVGGAGANILTGDGQNNMLTGGAGDDTLNGGAGDDVLKGMGGTDALNGGAGNDTLHGGAGDNTYNGGDGDDTYYITDTADVSGNAIGIAETEVTTAAPDGGTDTASFAMYAPDPEPTGTAAVFTVTLDDNVDNLVGSKYNDALTGNVLANEIDGGAGNDTIDGGAENDTLKGGAGNDTLKGGAGNDTLDGGPGDDTLEGGGGNNIFIVMMGEGNDNIGSTESPADPITSNDKIQFKGFGAGTTASYRALSGNTGFVITVGNQSIQVETVGAAFDEDDLKKIVTVE